MKVLLNQISTKWKFRIGFGWITDCTENLVQLEKCELIFLNKNKPKIYYRKLA